MIDETRHELISAALDGEQVDVQLLGEVLDTPAGRAAAAAFLLLKATVAADVIEPRQNVRDAVGIGRGPRRVWPSLLMPRVPVGIAASVAVLVAAGAFWLGTTWRIPGPVDSASQPAVIASQPATLPHAPSPAAAPQSGNHDAPPTPTRVLRFTPGVDWHEGS